MIDPRHGLSPFLALVVALAAVDVAAQSSASPTPAPERGARDSPRTRARRPPPDIPRPLYLSGNVVFADGAPAPPNIAIHRICANGRSIAEAHTDSKGRFSFEVGRALPLVSDASLTHSVPGDPGSLEPSQNPFAGQATVPGGARRRDGRLLGCRIVAVLPGHTSSHVDLGSRSDFDSPDVGTIVLSRREGPRGLAVSLTSLHAPESARESYEAGIEAASKERWGRAKKRFEDAVEEYPGFAEAWFGLGLVYDSLAEPEAARLAYREAASLDEDYLRPLVKLARLDVLEENWDAAADLTRSIMAKNPEAFPDAYYYAAIASLNLGQYETAERQARDGIERSAHEQYPQIEQVLGLSLAYQHDYEGGVEHLRRYLELSPDSEDAARVRDWIGKLEPLIPEQRAAEKRRRSSR